MRWLIIACALLLLTPSRPAVAHPHAWTDMTVEILFDQAGRVTGLRQSWLFDDFYTAFAVDGMDADGDGKPDQEMLDGILKENMKNLKEYHYFTKAWLGETNLKLKPVTEMATRMQGNRLEMSFVTSFDTPISPNGNDFSYAIYDPTYYIEMLHINMAKPVILSGAPEGCTYNLTPPNTDPNVVAEAAMLDANMRGETGLGIFFAERVSLTCPTR